MNETEYETSILCDLFPILRERVAIAPCDCYPIPKNNLYNVLIHLNDEHGYHWTYIALWLKGLGL